jgi:drug/metabolite transporter (DMT)-like permease
VSTSVPSRPVPVHRDPGAHRLALAAAALVTLLWSSSWVLIRLGLDDADLPPITFAALRYGAAAVVLWGWVLRPSGRCHLTGWTRHELGAVGALGVVYHAVTQGAQFVAIDHQPAATTSVVLSMTPLAVAFASIPLLGERVSRSQLTGAAVVVAGAAVYFSGNLEATAVGVAAAAVALGANVASSVAGRHVNRTTRRPAAVVTAVSMTVGAVVLAVVGLVAEDQSSLTGRALVIIAWLAVVNTALAFTLWNHALRHLSAVESSGINNLMLIQIAALAWIFLAERPGGRAVTGIALVSAGVYLTQQASRRPTAKVRRASNQRKRV